jgi:hypothetical protein
VPIGKPNLITGAPAAMTSTAMWWPRATG